MAEYDDRFKNYASAGLRWGLMLEDHPDAVRTYTEAKGLTLGDPFAARWPDATFIVCTIEIPGHADLHFGYKQIPTTVRRKDGNNYKNVPWENTYDNYAILQTQACGRALRSAGYPHSIPDLKLVMLWRRRNAEVEALVEALDAAAGDEDADEEDETSAPSAPRQEIRASTAGDTVVEQAVYKTSNLQARVDAGETTPGHRGIVVTDVMAPLLADDAIRSMWDQMSEPVRMELERWLLDKGAVKPATTRAYMKFLLEREHAAMKAQAAAGDPDWVDKAITTIANGKQEPAAEEPDPEQAALLEGIGEVRERLLALAGTRPNDYALAVKALEAGGISLKDRLTMEQLMEADEIVGRYEHADAT